MAEDLTGAYDWAIERCNNPWVGYSQYYRNEETIYNEYYQHDITYYDCSSFVWFALLHNGWDCVTANGGSTWPFTTGTMASVLPRLGFTQIDQNSVWKPMDIVLRSGHTEVVYQGGNASGICMGAHGDRGIALVDQVSIDTGRTYAGQYESLWRYTNGQVEGLYCWMGWTFYESAYHYLNVDALCMSGDGGRAYGLYQFDYSGGLVPFMQSCVDYDAVRYAGFIPFINMGVGNQNLINNQALKDLFYNYAHNYTDEFQFLQDKNAIEDYLNPALEYVQNHYGVNVRERNPVLLGTLFSLAIRDGYETGAQAMASIQGTTEANDLYVLKTTYDFEYTRHPVTRWDTNTTSLDSQYVAALDAYDNSTEVYIIPYGGYSPTPPHVASKNKFWVYQRNRLYQRSIRYERFR